MPMFNVEEEITSAYTQFNFNGEGFRGNLGLRYVMTDQSSAGFTGVGGGVLRAELVLEGLQRLAAQLQLRDGRGG